jgi:hypothetical protein
VTIVRPDTTFPSAVVAEKADPCVARMVIANQRQVGMAVNMVSSIPPSTSHMIDAASTTATKTAMP